MATGLPDHVWSYEEIAALAAVGYESMADSANHRERDSNGEPESYS
jgi:hypothetical protein